MKKVRNIFSDRVEVNLVTPLKGSKGDMTDESQVGMTDLPSILARYAGNLEELARWRGNLKYEDTTKLPTDYEEAYEKMQSARAAFDALPNNPFASFEEAYEAFKSGNFDKSFKPTDEAAEEVEKEVIDEKAEDKPSNE